MLILENLLLNDTILSYLVLGYREDNCRKDIISTLKKFKEANQEEKIAIVYKQGLFNLLITQGLEDGEATIAELEGLTKE